MNETRRDEATDLLARVLGSWGFILAQLIILLFWLLFGGIFHDPYPFLFLNLTLGMVSSLSAPLLMMSQNRQEARDRVEVEQDLATDVQNEVTLNEILTLLHGQGEQIACMQGQIDAQLSAALFPRRKKSKVIIEQGPSDEKTEPLH